MLKDKIIKYLHSIIHNVLFKDMGNDPFYPITTKKIYTT